MNDIYELNGLEDFVFQEVDEAEPQGLFERFDVHEREMISDIQTCIDCDENLKIDKWPELTLEERCEALQNLENNVAEIESRLPMFVMVEDLPFHESGYADCKNGLIVIARHELEDDSISGLREVVDTIIHEGRHSYQYQNVFINRTEINDDKFQGWNDNYKYGYLSQEEFGYFAYRFQPLEADAWAFAKQTVSGLSFR